MLQTCVLGTTGRFVAWSRHSTVDMCSNPSVSTDWSNECMNICIPLRHKTSNRYSIIKMRIQCVQVCTVDLSERILYAHLYVRMCV